MISIVIPAKNEENYLPLLLNQLKGSKAQIIVADAGSKDNTKKIALAYRAKVVKGGLPGVGRNNGAKHAKGDILFFIDADVRLSKDFIRKAESEFRKRDLGCASVDITTDSGNLIDEFLYFLNNIAQRASQYTHIKYGCGMCIMIKKELFLKIKGFDESITYAEDADLTRRAGKMASFGILDSCYVIATNRRFVKDGRFRTIMRFITTAIKNSLGIKITSKNSYFD